MDVIADLVLGYASEKKANGSAKAEVNGEHSDRFEEAVLYFLAQHYNYHKSRDLDKSLEYVDKLIEKDPKSVDYIQAKARIYKHRGNTKKAAETMVHAREIDGKDRYINTKTALYQLRDNQNEAALETMSKFTRNETVGGPLGDLHDMQCMWYITEDGEAHLRQRNLGLALKRFNSIADIFEIWHDDQFDFHSFSLRKGQIRAYVDMVRWEDHLRDHPFFTRAAINAVKIYLELADNPDLGNPNKDGTENMDATERKKARQKAKKEQEKQDKIEAEKKLAAAKKSNATGADGEAKKEDQDPKGLTLLQTKEPLEAALKFLTPLLEFTPQNIEAQNLGFEVHLRRSKCLEESYVPYTNHLTEKYLLALKSLLAARAIDSDNPKVHEQTIRFRETSKSPVLKCINVTSLLVSTVDELEDLPEKVSEVIKSSFDIVSADTDLDEYNTEWAKAHSKSPAHLQSAYHVRFILDDDDREQVEADMTKLLNHPNITFEQGLAGLSYFDTWKSEASTKDAYREAAAKKWPEATVFQKST
jgi:tetratricopeptide (TPR) repeat protein